MWIAAFFVGVLVGSACALLVAIYKIVRPQLDEQDDRRSSAPHVMG
jgi:hypothetical protein